MIPNAQSKAVAIVFQSIRPEIVKNLHKPKELELITEPVLGCQRPKELIAKVGSKPINDFLDLTKSSSMENLR